MARRLCLFLGGVWDGRRVEVGLELCIKVPVLTRNSVERYAGCIPDVTEVQYHYYHPHQFRGETDNWVIYAIEGMSQDTVFRRLIDGYRSQKERASAEALSGDEKAVAPIAPEINHDFIRERSLTNG